MQATNRSRDDLYPELVGEMYTTAREALVTTNWILKSNIGAGCRKLMPGHDD